MARKWITGIDIGHFSAKAVVLAYEGTDITLVNHLELHDCDAIFTDPHTLKHQETVKKLKNLGKVAPIFRKNAAIALPDSTVMSKVVTLEKGLSDLEQEYAIHQLMGHQTPYPNQALAIDFIKVSDTRESSSEAFRVQVTRQSIVDKWSAVTARIGLRPCLMDTQLSALRGLQSRLVLRHSEFRDWAVLEFGATHVSLVPPLSLSADQGKTWSTASHQYQLSSSATEFKSEAERIFASVASKVSSQLQLYRSMLGDNAAPGIIVTGGHAHDDSVCDMVSRYTGKAAQCFDARQGVLIESQGIGMVSATFACAIGIALNGVHWLREHGHGLR
ncbi:pilus assembly protein PilM [Vibrio hangzhouensis]|uniref:Type IV pilus assembly protein PilM n=1 Tax=Vibrio hangzhouensis TaxID=462991 RepID=A0A1H6BT57_9VIBR|nr:pilus assembly protein PilM [Vibrio hangzhouensis]SEG63884.1 type IV pilus assembly protein PilM [Vibrio hangzhouensis]